MCWIAPRSLRYLFSFAVLRLVIKSLRIVPAFCWNSLWMLFRWLPLFQIAIQANIQFRSILLRRSYRKRIALLPSGKYNCKRIAFLWKAILLLAGGARLELASPVLETGARPLYQPPKPLNCKGLFKFCQTQYTCLLYQFLSYWSTWICLTENCPSCGKPWRKGENEDLVAACSCDDCRLCTKLNECGVI